MLYFHSKPGEALKGSIQVPGDKSISHRAIMLGAIAEGQTAVEGFLFGEDNLATLHAFNVMGVKIDRPALDRLLIHGVGKRGLKQPSQILNLENSGTAFRLMMGLLAGQHFASQLTGDTSLCRRPMGRVADPLRLMGAHIVMNNNCPPVKIEPVEKLHGISYELPVASAQVKSAILLAGLFAEGSTTVIESMPSRDHTERMLRSFDYPLDIKRNNTLHITLDGQSHLSSTTINVPSDLSSAAFFIVAASLVPGSDLLLTQVGINPTRIGILNILKAMGADFDIVNERSFNAEPVADLRVRSAPLKGITIPKEQISLAIDEFPILLIAAACAEGETLLTGAEELRVKESDRIKAMVDGLVAIGIEAEAFPDGCRVIGGTIKGGEVESLGDHRIAMAFAIAGLRSKAGILIRDCASVATSFPTFIDLAKQLNLNIQSNSGNR